MGKKKKSQLSSIPVFLMEVHQLFHSARVKQAVSVASLNTVIKSSPNFLLSLECCQNQMSSFFFVMDVTFLCEERERRACLKQQKGVK